MVEHAGVGSRVGARRAPDRRLVDADDLVDLLEPLDPRVRAGTQAGAVEPVGDRRIDDLVDERRLPRSRHAGYAAERAKRDRDVDSLQVVLRGSPDYELAPGHAPPLRNRDLELSAEVLAGQRPRRAGDRGGRALGDHLTPCSPAPGPRSTTWSADRIVPSSCSTTITVLPRSRSRSSVEISFRLSRWCSPIEGSSRM